MWNSYRTGDPEKIKISPRKSPEKWTFLSLAFYNAPSLHTVEILLVSVKFLSAILGPEMGAPILWTPGKMRPFCRKTSMSMKFLVLGGGGILGFGGGKCRFYFFGRADFSEVSQFFSFVLVVVGSRTIVARYAAKWGIAQMCLCKIKYQGGVSHHFGRMLTFVKKYRAICGMAAIVSQHIARYGATKDPRQNREK